MTMCMELLSFLGCKRFTLRSCSFYFFKELMDYQGTKVQQVVKGNQEGRGLKGCLDTQEHLVSQVRCK